MKAANQDVERFLAAVGAGILHVNQALRNVDLVIGLKLYVFFGFSFFDHTLEIHSKFLTGLTRQLHLTFVGKIAKAPGFNDRFADGVTLIGRNFLWSLPFNCAVYINSTSRFFTYPVDRQNHGRVI